MGVKILTEIEIQIFTLDSSLRVFMAVSDLFRLE